MSKYSIILEELQKGGATRRPRVEHEAMEQETLFSWAEHMQHIYPCLALLHHIPNGGYRNTAEAARLKRQGVKPGVPDICLPVARGAFHGLYIELKAEGGTASKKQKEWIEALRKEGYAAYICEGWIEAKTKIENYINT